MSPSSLTTSLDSFDICKPASDEYFPFVRIPVWQRTPKRGTPLWFSPPLPRWRHSGSPDRVQRGFTASRLPTRTAFG
jgi:hypothetical protein